jgi:hypothetical protein
VVRGKEGRKRRGKVGKGGGVFKRGLLLLSFLNQKTPGVFTGGLTAALLIRQNRRKAVPICVYGSY